MSVLHARTYPAEPAVAPWVTVCNHDAGGTLRESITYRPGNHETSHVYYFDGHRYESVSGELLVQTDEGATLIDAHNAATHIGYQVDHLGNVVLAYSDANGDGWINPATEYVEESRYFPYGLKVEAYDRQSPSLPFAYNGAEEDTENGLHLTTYRTMAPEVGLWGQVDPKAEASYAFSPYAVNYGNPILYTDPDGDLAFLAAVPFIIKAMAIGGAALGTANVVAQGVAGDLNNFGDGLEAFGTGFVAGAAVTGAVVTGLGVPVLGPALKVTGGIYAASTGLSIVRGVGQGVFTGDWSALGHAGEIALGLGYSDNRRPFFNQVFQLTSRFTWESIQTSVGYNYSQLRNTFGNVDRVDLYRGATFTQRWSNPDGFGGISLGNFINVNSARPDPGIGDLVDEPDRGRRPGLLRHEYGHIFDSQRWGPLYLFGVGIPSASGAQWTEDRADDFARRYERRYP